MSSSELGIPRMARSGEYAEGDIIPFHLTPSIVVASFFVSLIGAYTTVELLQRRTNARGWNSWFELGPCAVSFGLVGIWCMHYVGNRAIVLGNGEADLQLGYNPGYTILSAFMPIMALFFAFATTDKRHLGKNYLLVALSASGVTAGLAIVGMHYIGNLGVSNYNIHFDAAYVGGAILIACMACVTALTLIFVLKDRWINILPYRVMTAILLAGAVSSMHFEATMGTTYRLKYRRERGPSSRDTNVIIASVLSLITIPICIGIAISTSRRQKQLADRAQQVILACARFDPEGRLMVTHEGLLPSQKISIHENQRSFEDQFNVTHPAFQWIFRVSHNWPSVVRWIPNMRRHLQAVHFIDDPRRKKSESTDSSLTWDLTPEGEDYSVIFRQSFCVAASYLAADFNESLADVGTLFEGVMATGTLAAGGAHRHRSSLKRILGAPVHLVRDLEATIGADVFGKGQILFLVHQCDKKDVTRMVSAGYRFVSLDKIDSHLARSMQVPASYLNSYLEKVQHRARMDENLDIPNGTFLGCFVLRAGISKRTWDVLVRRDYQYRLPSVQLTPFLLDPLNSNLLVEFDNMSVTNCLSRLTQKTQAVDEPNLEFYSQFQMKILELQSLVSEPFFRQAIFCSKQIKVPTLNPSKGRLSYCSLLAFHIIPDVHAAELKMSPKVTYTPISFLRCRQQVLEGVHHRATFDRKIHNEFAALFTTRDGTVLRPSAARRGSISQNAMMLSKGLPLKLFSIKPRTTPSVTAASRVTNYRTHNRDSSTDTGDPGTPMDSTMPFGGIMVSSDVTVESSLKEPGEALAEFTDVGTSAYAGTADVELPTYVDELYNIAVAKWQRP